MTQFNLRNCITIGNIYQIYLICKSIITRFYTRSAEKHYVLRDFQSQLEINKFPYVINDYYAIVPNDRANHSH